MMKAGAGALVLRLTGLTLKPFPTPVDRWRWYRRCCTGEPTGCQSGTRARPAQPSRSSGAASTQRLSAACRLRACPPPTSPRPPTNRACLPANHQRAHARVPTSLAASLPSIASLHRTCALRLVNGRGGVIDQRGAMVDWMGGVADRGWGATVDEWRGGGIDLGGLARD